MDPIIKKPLHWPKEKVSYTIIIGLISTGFFARTRNPNYLGEMLIYGSFATCTGYWLAYALVISIWCTLFAINMYLKDELSYKFKEGWKEYK